MINKRCENTYFRQYYESSRRMTCNIGSITIILSILLDTVLAMDSKQMVLINVVAVIIDLICFILVLLRKASISIGTMIIVYTTIADVILWDFLLMSKDLKFSQYLLRDLFVIMALMILCAMCVDWIHAYIISFGTSIVIGYLAILSGDTLLRSIIPCVIVVFCGVGIGFSFFIRMLEISAYEIHIAKQKLEEKNNELEQINLEWSLQKNELLETQSQLIQSEKMATLGQLISGVAHEINTPLGAIKASINNISVYIKSTLEEKMPELYRTLNDEELSIFFSILHKSMENTLTISSKEKRAYKKQLIELLDDENIEDSNSIADTFVDMGIYDGIEPYFDLLKNKKGELVLQTCYEISGISRNSINISIAVERAAKIIVALKNYSHNNISAEPVETDITEGIETVLSLYHHNLKQGTEVIRNYKEIPKIMCFPDELNQVWTNIINNALQAMDYKGIIEINIYPKDNDINIEISNNGARIPDEIREKVFEPFFTTKPQGEGTGIGLNIVKKIIQKHNGDIYVESDDEKTTFYIKLPMIQTITNNITQ